MYLTITFTAEIPYAIVVKNNLYDALEYAGQVEKTEMRKESEEIGELKRARESARRFYEMGIGVEKVAEGVGCDVKTVKEWLKLPQ